MVHHNPGEPPFDTCFTDPGELRSRGFNGQCFKHINTVLRLENALKEAPPATEEEQAWFERFTADRVAEMRAAKAAGLAVFYHIDLFVLPKRLVETRREELVDEVGKISLSRPATQEIHRELFAELFERFPEVDGLIPRVGETYLYDTPFHTGNGAVRYEGPTVRDCEIEGFIRLLEFLREEVCVRHNRWLLHRTWDTWPNRFHANREVYLKVTDAIPTHEKLIFSIKHTQVDFQRYAAWNPCLGAGQHRQVVEVQCQREYEGKGAYPNYSALGVIEGFPERTPGRGLRGFLDHPLFAGVYSWSRGGGWYGPSIHRNNEFWCDVNVSVLAAFLRNPSSTEPELFQEVMREQFGIAEKDTKILHEIAELSLEAIRKGKCCEAWDTRPGSEHDNVPTNMWMRDDVLGGWDLLDPVFAYLRSSAQVERAIAEKMEAVEMWQQLEKLAQDLEMSEQPELRQVVVASCVYGRRLFTFIGYSWQAMLQEYTRRQGDASDPDSIQNALRQAQTAWADYQKLPGEFPAAASLYRDHAWHWPGKPAPEGIGAALADVALSLKKASQG